MSDAREETQYKSGQRKEYAERVNWNQDKFYNMLLDQYNFREFIVVLWLVFYKSVVYDD